MFGGGGEERGVITHTFSLSIICFTCFSLFLSFKINQLFIVFMADQIKLWQIKSNRFHLEQCFIP